MVKETNRGRAVSKYKLTSSGIAAIYSSHFYDTEFSSTERRAAARAIIRHQKHVDNEHITVRNAGGLHPMYVALHGQGEGNQQEQNEIKMVLSESLDDVFDSVTTQDRLDGGITLLLRCPGWHAATDLTVDNLCVDVYITPRELAEGGEAMTEHVARVVQAFGEDIALPHLHRFTNRCVVEGIKAPQLSSFARQLQVETPAYLPLPQKGSARIRCRCMHKAARSMRASVVDEHDTDFWSEAAEIAAQYDEHEPSPVNSSSPSQTIKLEIGNPQTSLTVPNVATHPYSASPGIMNSVPNKADDGFEGAIIAFGPETDSILDRFKLGDHLIPRLRVLTTTVRSSQWEAILRAEEWGLNYEQAVNLSGALLADIKRQQFLQAKPPSKSNLLTKFVCFALLVCLLAMFALAAA